MTKECECAAHSAAECVCGAWDEPPQRTWVGLSKEDFIYFCSYVRADVLSEIEAKLKELNT